MTRKRSRSPYERYQRRADWYCILTMVLAGVLSFAAGVAMGIGLFLQ